MPHALSSASARDSLGGGAGRGRCHSPHVTDGEVTVREHPSPVQGPPAGKRRSLESLCPSLQSREFAEPVPDSARLPLWVTVQQGSGREPVIVSHSLKDTFRHPVLLLASHPPRAVVVGETGLPVQGQRRSGGGDSGAVPGGTRRRHFCPPAGWIRVAPGGTEALPDWVGDRAFIQVLSERRAVVGGGGPFEGLSAAGSPKILHPECSRRGPAFPCHRRHS